MDKIALDITNAEAIKEVYTKQSFDVCINAAAYTDVDGAETNKEFAYEINATAVEALPNPANKMGAGLCIFQPTMSLMALWTGPTPQKTRPIH